MKKLIALLLILMCTFALTFCTKNTCPEDLPEVLPENVVGDPAEDDFEEDTSGDISFDATLYFPDTQALYLHPSEYTFGIDTNVQTKEVAILEALFDGPGFDHLAPSLEGEDLINSVTVDENGLCTIDFKKDFVLLNTGGSSRESFALGSIVNSLCSLDYINSVKINIDGDTAHEFGHTTLDMILVPQTDLIAKEVE